LPLKFDRIRAESPMLHALQQAYGGRAAVLLRPACGSPWIPLDPTWKEPERHLNAGRRSDLRRARRRAAQYGWLSCEVIAPTPNQLPALLDEAFSIEASGWKGRAGTALASDESRASFVRHYAAAACERGILRMCFLRLGGKAAAMQFSVETGGAFWLLKIAYDEAFSKCSPGTLLMVETLRHAAERGLNSYELLGTVEPWTEIWTRYLRPAISVRIYPVSRHGMAALAADMAATARRAVTRAVDRRRR
jgi:CelD/BcsL family acetyltransferase involved in cellulose biosynthesis